MVRVVHFVKLRFGSVLWCALCDIPVKRCPDRLYSHSFCRGGGGGGGGEGVHVLLMLFVFIYLYWCPTRSSYQIMFVPFNSNTSKLPVRVN